MDFERIGRLKIKNERNKRNTNLCLKYAAAISASITTAGFGMIISWTSPALPHLTSPASQFSVSEIQGAWIASLSGCGTISGYLLNSLLIDRIGPKRTLLFSAMPQILSWIIIYLGRNWILLCFARIVGGVGYGGGLCSTAVYLGEIGDQNTRGIFLVLIKMSINIGIFITMFFGAFLSYNAMNLALLGIPIIFVVSFSFMPDANQFGGQEDVVDVLKENRDAVLKEINIVLKENRDDDLKENAIDPKENTIDLKNNTSDSNEDTIDLKENTIDLLKENTLIVLKESTIVVLNESTVDVLQENTIDFLQENTKCVLNENALDVLKENTINITNQNNIDALNENRKNDINKLTNNSNKGLKEKGKDKSEEEMSLLKNKEILHSLKNKSQKNIWRKLFFLKNNRKALLIIFIASLTDIFSGHMAIVSFTQQIFEYSGASLKAEYAALVLAALKIGASLISTLVVERFGRRVLFLSTGILAAFAQGLVGLFFFLKMYLKSDVSSITWLPLFGVSMYEVVGSVGLSSLYYVYQGELFSSDVKGLGVTCTNIAYETVTFFIKFNFQMVIDAAGIYSVFWGFGICCVIGSWITYWISPETKGKSKQEIQKLLGEGG